MQTNWWILGLVAAFFAWRFVRFRLVRRRLGRLMQEGALLVDVRSEAEFAAGHNPASVNVPLPELAARARDWNRDRTVVLCCASGTRSGMAIAVLRAQGFRSVLNAGPWSNTFWES